MQSVNVLHQPLDEFICLKLNIDTSELDTGKYRGDIHPVNISQVHSGYKKPPKPPRRTRWGDVQSNAQISDAQTSDV